MAYQVYEWVMDNSEATGGARTALFVFSAHANPDGGEAWADLKTLMRKTKLSRRAAQYAVDELEQARCIVKTGERPGKQGGTPIVVYRVSMRLSEQDWTQAELLRRGRKGADSARVQNLRAVGADGAEQGANSAKSAAESAPDSIHAPILNPVQGSGPAGAQARARKGGGAAPKRGKKRQNSKDERAERYLAGEGF